MDEAVVSELMFTPGEARIRVLTWLTGRYVQVVFRGGRGFFHQAKHIVGGSSIDKLCHCCTSILHFSAKHIVGWSKY